LSIFRSLHDAGYDPGIDYCLPRAFIEAQRGKIREKLNLDYRMAAKLLPVHIKKKKKKKKSI
jgi:hypothetical protein